MRDSLATPLVAEEDAAVARLAGDKRETEPRVDGDRFDNLTAGLDLSLTLASIDHRDTHAVLAIFKD